MFLLPSSYARRHSLTHSLTFAGLTLAGLTLAYLLPTPRTRGGEGKAYHCCGDLSLTELESITPDHLP